MKIFIDTNIIMDVLMNREPHVDRSAALLRLCGSGITGCLASSQTTDIFYLLRREGRTNDEAKDILKSITKNLTLLDVTSKEVNAGLDSAMKDYEDALAAQVAKKARASIIITRNTKDFKESPVPAMTPAEFLDKFFKADEVVN